MASTPNFFLALVAGYALPSVLWFVLYKKRPALWPKAIIEKPGQPKFELIYAIVAIVLIMAIGQVFRAGYLLPAGQPNTVWGFASWWLNNLIIYSPIFVLLLIRRQSLATVFITPRNGIAKVVYGLIATVLGLSAFLIIEGKLEELVKIINVSFDYQNISNFLPVFLEGVAIAFLFVRLKWVLGMRWAIGIPALLFALAHVPRSLAEGSGIGTIIYFSILTALVTVIVLRTTHESRDIIWLGILHYFMDIAINAFG